MLTAVRASHGHARAHHAAVGRGSAGPAKPDRVDIAPEPQLAPDVDPIAELIRLVGEQAKG
jgi:hypothetical protein